MLKKVVVKKILHGKTHALKDSAHAFAPSNIALAKYWGKRDTELNLPMNSSLSISLKHKGATAQIGPHHATQITVNTQPLALNTQPGKRLAEFLALFDHHYQLNLDVNIPFAAGLASSACIFAAIVLALNELHHWQLPTHHLSILARLGSGSACRSIETGFVEWHRGKKTDGMDSFAVKLKQDWPEFCVGLVLIDTGIKPVSSREGMLRTVNTSPLYAAWPSHANQSVETLYTAIQDKDFPLLGKTAEQNAQTMHATMLSAWPSLIYSTEKTLSLMRTVWALREQGHEIYFTQDAGPNLKLLFLEESLMHVKNTFSKLEIIQPFKSKVP